MMAENFLLAVFLSISVIGKSADAVGTTLTLLTPLPKQKKNTKVVYTE